MTLGAITLSHSDAQSAGTGWVHKQRLGESDRAERQNAHPGQNRPSSEDRGSPAVLGNFLSASSSPLFLAVGGGLVRNISAEAE